MGKRGHHKKNLKKDKSKVKFKVGRTLPKGQNITDTSFKVKKIVIKEQLKSGGLETVNKRNLNLKEILSRLQHYNTNMKLDNLTGLKEILSKDHDLLANNLMSIIDKLAELITDKESSIRKEAISQLTCVIGRVPVWKLRPFVCLLCSYLGAALSHISKDIQEDALLLLDGILSTPDFPPLILSTSPATPSSSRPFDLILQGLLNQISEQKEISSAGKPSGWERKLNVDPEAKLADSQRRVKVLNQLRSLLKSALEMRRSSQSERSQSDGPKSVLWKDVLKCGGYVAISEPSYCVIEHIYPTSLDSCFYLTTSLADSEPLAHGEHLKAIVSALVPILWESWKEVGPCKQGSTNYELTVEAAGLLRIILDILVILLEVLMLCERDSVDFGNLVDWFRISYSKPFFDTFMPAFPFSCSGFHRKKNRNKRQKVTSTWMVENIGAGKTDGKQEELREIKRDSSECFDHSLLLAQLFCTIELSKSSKTKDKKPLPHYRYLEKILSFLTNSLEDPVSCHRHEKQMSAIIWSILTCRRTPEDQSIQWHLGINKIELLIHALVMSCFRGCSYEKNSSIAHCHYFKLLCDIIKERRLAEFHGFNAFGLWVTSLPEMLCFPSKEAVEVLSDIARQCNLPAFNSTIKAHLPRLFFSLKVNPKYNNSEESEKLKGMLALLYWVQDWDAKELKHLGVIIQSYPKETSSLVELFRTRKVHLGQESKFSRLLESTNWWQQKMLNDV